MLSCIHNAMGSEIPSFVMTALYGGFFETLFHLISSENTGFFISAVWCQPKVKNNLEDNIEVLIP